MKALAIMLVLAGCTDDGPSVKSYVAEVATLDGATHARFISGAPPHDASGPALQVMTNPAVIPGGTTPVTLTADAPFGTAIVAVDGLGGYFEIDVPNATTIQLLVTLSQELDATDFVWRYGVGTGGSFGYTTTPVTVVPVGTGDVQVSLSWTTQADVDLHVIDPANEEIFWSHRDSASGGELDLDSNAACGSDGPRNENITWPTGGAPAGTYQVLVDYWSSCHATATPFVVTVNAKGQPVQTFSGTFTGDGDSGGPGAGQPITTFTTGARARSLQRVIGTFTVEPGSVTYSK